MGGEVAGRSAAATTTAPDGRGAPRPGMGGGCQLGHGTFPQRQDRTYNNKKLDVWVSGHGKEGFRDS